MKMPGAAVGPIFPYYFLLQGLCGLLAVIPALAWSWAEPQSSLHKARSLLLIVALVLVVAGWPLVQKVSALRALRYSADQTVAELAMLLSLDPTRRLHDKTRPYWRIPVLKTAAIKDQGIPQVVDAMEQHRDYLVESGMLANRAQRQVRSEVEALVLQAVVNTLKAKTTEEEWNALVEDITKRERDPYTVASELEERIGLTR